MAELDRRLRWRAAPLLVFLGLMAGLCAVAVVSLLAPRKPVGGIPNDTDARSAFEVMRGQGPIGMGGLRFRSELTGESVPGQALPDPAAAESARRLLSGSWARRPLDPRLPAALAHLDLAQRRFVGAERGYRKAILLAHGYGEARLGLGAALALRADGEPDPLEQRSLRLQALAQFAAVPRDDPLRAHALYDRVALLLEVGRRAEGERLLREYLESYPADAWADSLMSRARSGG